MTNHVHLLLTPATAHGCGLLMKHLAQRHAQHINRTYRRSGTLWEGRFRSCLTQREDYLLACYRYIELNPVRAGMVRDPGLYKWSSYRSNADGVMGDLVKPHELYLALGTDPVARAAIYRGLCRAGIDQAMVDNIRHATNGGFVLGNTRFQDAIARQLGQRVTRGRSGRPTRD